MFDLQGLQGLWMNWKKGELFDLSNEPNQEIFIYKTFRYFNFNSHKLKYEEMMENLNNYISVNLTNYMSLSLIN